MIAITTCLFIHHGNSQQAINTRFGKGIQFMAHDSSFYNKFSVRFQTLYLGVQDFDSKQYNDVLLIRRFRLKFDGWVFSPKIVYKFELGQSNRDTGGGNRANFNNTARIILDAVVKWNFYRSWTIWFGQTKLPGNRERVISSQKLQTVDRSLANARYNLDRDLGIQLSHQSHVGRGVIREIFSIAMGEGRDIITNNLGGYAYTGRIEFLPMGEFQNKGDYFGSDLEREDAPKLAVGVTFDYNDGAARQRGQLGDFVEDSLGNQLNNSLSTVFVDAIFKYRGLSVLSEYHNKSAEENIFGYREGGEIRYTTGTGLVIQTGYLFGKNWELVGRYTTVKPDELDYSSVIDENEYTFGISRYIVGHNLKVQTDFSYRERQSRSDFFMFRFQMELAL